MTFFSPKKYPKDVHVDLSQKVDLKLEKMTFFSSQKYPKDVHVDPPQKMDLKT